MGAGTAKERGLEGQWQVKPPWAQAEQLGAKLRVGTLVGQLLYNRRIEQFDEAQVVSAAEHE